MWQIILYVLVLGGIMVGINWIKSKFTGRSMSDQYDVDHTKSCRNCSHYWSGKCHKVDGYEFDVDADKNTCNDYHNKRWY